MTNEQVFAAEQFRIIMENQNAASAAGAEAYVAASKLAKLLPDAKSDELRLAIKKTSLALAAATQAHRDALLAVVAAVDAAGFDDN